MASDQRTVVLLFGLLRDYRSTAGSLLRHVVAPSHADILYFGPAQSDRPARAHGGEFDQRGFFLRNPKGDFDALLPVDVDDLRQVYGDALVNIRFHQISQQYFRELADAICRRDEWLLMLSPHRLLSMFYNISGVAKLLEEHERERGICYDRVILTRPDLAFYQPVNPKVSRGELHIADGEGFDDNGVVRRGNAAVFFYKNAANGDYVPAGRMASFNDQILVFRREELDHFERFYLTLIEAFRSRVPPSPETIFHLLLVQRAGLRVVAHNDWVHEIFRADDAVIKSVVDTPEITRIDPRHPKADRFLSPEERLELHGPTA